MSRIPAKENKSDQPPAELQRIRLRRGPGSLRRSSTGSTPRPMPVPLLFETRREHELALEYEPGPSQGEGSQAMRVGISCDCTLCSIELQLLRDLYHAEREALGELFSPSEPLRAYRSSSSLLSDLKSSPADERSDRLLLELFAVRASNPAITECLLILTFLPMLHGVVRRVSRQQPELSPEDISQQALSFLLQYLQSEELQARQSHFAFAISRAVKRQVFEWASRESGKARLTNHCDAEVLGLLAFEQPCERYALLRHFLWRCVTRGLLTDTELHLLIDRTNGEEFADCNGTSSNAVRQRLKRLLAKLRRFAR